MPGIKLKENYDLDKEFKKILKVRQNQTSSDLCSDNTKHLYTFKKEIFSYHFKDKPNYEKLRNILENLKDLEISSRFGKEIALKIVNSLNHNFENK